MKKVGRILTALAVAMLFCGLAVFAACGKKKEKAELTLDAGEGGTIEKSVYSVEVGASLSDFLKDILPTAEDGLEFAGWYLGDAAVAETDTMPAEGASVKAKYYAGYTVKLHLESVTGEYADEETATGKAFYGEAFTYTPEKAHFGVDEDKENKISSEKLGKNEQFEAWLARDIHYVVYHANAPAGAEIDDDVRPLSARYGATVTLGGGDFEASALYRFAGWSTSETGAIEYEAGDTVTLEGDLALYAVWDVGYQDRFGGGDILFFPQAESTQSIMLRAGVEHTGARNGDAFTFSAGEKELLKGKTFADGTFIYFRDAQKGVTYRHLNAYTRNLDQDLATLTFDGEGGVTLHEGTSTVQGQLFYKPATMLYEFHGTGGNDFEFLLTEYGSEGEKVFLRQGAEVGEYTCFDFIYTDEVEAVFLEALTLNGLGTAIVYDLQSEGDEAEAILAGSYTPVEGSDSEIDLVLTDANDQRTTARVKLMTYQGGNGYVKYNKKFAKEFRASDNGTLTLDGYSGTLESAVYMPATGDEVHGQYVILPSYDDSYLVYVIDAASAVHVFRISGNESDGSFTALGEDYFEYLRFLGTTGNESAFGSTALVFGEDDEATLYGYIGEEVLSEEGTVSEVAGKEGRYLFTGTSQSFEYELGGDKYMVDGIAGYFRYFLLYPAASSVNELSEKDGGTAKLRLVKGANVYDAQYIAADGTEYAGAYTVNPIDGVSFDFDLVEFKDAKTGATFYFALVKGAEENYVSFVVLGGESGLYLPENVASVEEATSALVLLKGAPQTAGAADIVVFMSIPEDDDHVTITQDTYTIAEGEVTATFPGATRHFLLVEDGNGSAAFVERDALFAEGAQTFTKGTDSLVLDGYGFATYTVGGTAREGSYTLMEIPGQADVRRAWVYGIDGEYVFEAYCDVNFTNHTYETVDYFWGQYYTSDDSGDVLLFDGYGHVTRHNIASREADDTLTTLEEGTYEVVRDDSEQTILRVTLGEEADARTFDVLLWVSASDDEGTKYYTVANDAANTYTSADWELFTFDRFGNGVYTDVYGITYEGTYNALSSKVLSFTSGMLDEEILIELAANGTFVRRTEGFIIDGTVLLKYLGGEEDAQGKVTIPEEVTEIAPLAFSKHEYGSRYRGAELKAVDLKNVERIGESAFNGCVYLTEAEGLKVKYIGKSAFYGCIALKVANFTNVETIDEFAFHLAEDLETVDYDHVAVIYSSAYSDCYSLKEVHLAGIERLYEGVFYDCISLETVDLGSSLTQIGTPDEPVAGVFEREAGGESAALTVTIAAEAVPTVGVNVFANVPMYTVVVNTIDIVKNYFKDSAWAAYNANVGAKSTQDGTYYYYDYGTVKAVVLNGLARCWSGYSLSTLGAYSVDGTTLKSFKFNAEKGDDYCDESELGTFADNVLTYSDYGYTKVGTAQTFEDYYVSSDTLTFTPVEGNLFAMGTVYSVEGTWTVSSVEKAVKVELVRETSAFTLSMVSEGYRRELTLFSSNNKVSVGDPVFEPIVTVYTAEDGSYLAIAQRNEDATEYTASAILMGIWDDAGDPFTLTNIAVEKKADGSFAAKEAQICAGYSYELTFAVDEEEETFTYSADREKQTVVKAADGSARALIYQNAAGEITNVVFELANGGEEWQEVSEKVHDRYAYEHDGNTYHHWTVYDYNVAGEYLLTITNNQGTLRTSFVQNKVVKAQNDDGAWAIGFFDEHRARTALYIRYADHDAPDGVYVLAEDIAEEGDHLKVTVGTSVYYVAFDVPAGTATVVTARRTYRTAAEDDIQGGVTVERDSDGTILSMSLAIDEGETINTFGTMVVDPNEHTIVYIFVSATKGYYVNLATADCDIYELTKHEFRTDDETICVTAFLNSEGNVYWISKVEKGGTEAEFTQKIYDDIMHFTVKDVVYYLHYESMESECKVICPAQKTFEVDGWRFTVTFDDAEYTTPQSVIKVEQQLADESYVERQMTWVDVREDEGKYSVEVDLDTHDEISVYEYTENYYFTLDHTSGDWTLTDFGAAEWNS